VEEEVFPQCQVGNLWWKEIDGRAYSADASVTSTQQRGPNPTYAEVLLLLFWVCSARMERLFI